MSVWYVPGLESASFIQVMFEIIYTITEAERICISTKQFKAMVGKGNYTHFSFIYSTCMGPVVIPLRYNNLQLTADLLNLCV